MAEASRTSRHSDLLWFAAWGALVGGVGELVVRTIWFQFSSTLRISFYLNPQALWLAPLANLPISALAIASAWVVVRDDTVRVRVAAFIAAALAAAEMLLVTDRVMLWAVALLALGLGIEVSRRAARRPSAFRRFVVRSTVAMASVAAVGGVMWNARQYLREREVMRVLATTPSGAPNVLLLVLDTVRAIELGLYGYRFDTSPVIDSLAREGIRFDNAIAPAPWTLPSHASMFTGKYPHELSAGWSAPLDGAHSTLAEAMRDAGYATGGFVGNLLYGHALFGLNRGFIRYRDYPLTFGEALHTTTLWKRVLNVANRFRGRPPLAPRVDAGTVNDEFLSWQASLGGRPFFAFLNYFDAHAPYAPPAPYDTMFLGREPRARMVHRGRYPDSLTIADLQRAYDGAIRYVNDEIGRLLSELERRGVLRNTIVVVTADHGESFSEHGFMGHGSTLYSTQVRVPLVIVMPRGARGARVEQTVSLRDLAATLLDLSGVGASRLPGTALTPLWTEGAQDVAPPSAAISFVKRAPATPLRYPSARGDIAAVTVPEWSLIAYEDGKEELFRVSSDPLEQHDFAGDSAFIATRRQLRALLRSAIAAPEHQLPWLRPR